MVPLREGKQPGIFRSLPKLPWTGSTASGARSPSRFRLRVVQFRLLLKNRLRCSPFFEYARLKTGLLGKAISTMSQKRRYAMEGETGNGSIKGRASVSADWTVCNRHGGCSSWVVLKARYGSGEALDTFTNQCCRMVPVEQLSSHGYDSKANGPMGRLRIELGRLNARAPSSTAYMCTESGDIKPTRGSNIS